MAVKEAAEIVDKLTALTGAGSVVEDPALLEGYSSCLGINETGTVLASVRPENRDQVRALVQLANSMALNLIPVSSGPPHLRGATVPQGPAVMLDLSGLNKIVRVDKQYRVAIIEPGVQFPQLKAEVERQGLKMHMPLLPRANKSVIASYLEREPIQMPRYHWDMSDPLLCTEMIFGTGDLFRTGTAAGPGSLQEQWKNGIEQRNPMGPAASDFMRVVQGSQGTIGVITWASIKLEMLPEARKLFFVQSDRLDRLIDFSYRVNRVKLADEFMLFNRFALASVIGESAEEIRNLAAQQAAYTAVYCLGGYEYFPEKRVEYEEHDTGKIAQQFGVLPRQEVPGAGAVKMMRILDNPSSEPYWKLRPAGGFREIFFLTTLDKAGSFIDLMRQLAASHGYPVDEIGVYVQPIQQARSCHLEFDLFFDPGDAAAAQRVEKLAGEAAMVLAEAGAFFSRPYGLWADVAYARCPGTAEALRKVKGIFDPNAVLNRGRLCYGEVG